MPQSHEITKSHKELTVRAKAFDELLRPPAGESRQAGFTILAA